MSVCRRPFVIVVAFIISVACLGNFAAAQQIHEVAAERALGPHWRVISRASGMVFAGNVLEVKMFFTGNDGTIPTIEMKFRVEHAIAGVQPGQVITIREWEGAWAGHRPIRVGQHLLLFFYAPSSLGLTSIVGGPLGQIELDATGRSVTLVPEAAPLRGTPRLPLPRSAPPVVNWRQLQHAIRSARGE